MGSSDDKKCGSCRHRRERCTCKKKEKKHCKPSCQCVPPPEPDCLEDCCRMNVAGPITLTGAATQLVAQVNGEASSPARVLSIEAEVSVIATGLVPANAAFEIQVDGNTVFPIVTVATTVLGPPGTNEARSVVLRASVNVGAGPHTVALLGTSVLQTNLVLSGSLTVCEKVIS